MAVQILKERWTSKVAELTLGAGENEIKVGGESTLPYLLFEGEVPNSPIVALEVTDVEPEELPELLASAWEGVMGDPVAWANKIEEYGADAVCLRLDSAHPDKGNRSAAEVAATAKAVADAIKVPLIIIGCGVDEKDQEIIPVVADAVTGKGVLLGCANPETYKQYVAAANANGHNVLASSPLDINLAKQLNILMTEMALPVHKIAIDPLVGALGYGIEYAYSIMERARVGALTGDKMLAMPVLCFVGQEAWKAKEAKDVESPEGQNWGDQQVRGLLWEAMTATTFLHAGGSIFVMKHPEAMKMFRQHVAAVSKPAEV